MKYTRLELTGRERTANGKRMVECRCDCGTTKWVRRGHLIAGKVRSCGCLRTERNQEKIRIFNAEHRGEKHPKFKTGKSVTKGGYIVLNCPPNYPGLHTRKKHLEHIVVMEQHLGRVLLPNENIHHKNGTRSDNRLENLELKVSAHGKGQSVDDLLTWAKHVQELYG